MLKRLDRYLFLRLLTITLFVLVLLIFIFVIIDFSENSDDFTDQGATFAQIWGTYYLNYIPEMVRLVTPVAVFVATLWLTGQMSDRFEIVALKAAGVSLYRIFAPYLIFALVMATALSYLDGYVIPPANAKRIDFEHQYLKKKPQQIDRSSIYRQESDSTIMRVNYFDTRDSTAYKVDLYEFRDDSVTRSLHSLRMVWIDTLNTWRMIRGDIRTYTSNGFTQSEFESKDTTLNVLPRDLARSTSDIYQLTYPEALNYIEGIQRSGAGRVSMPQIQLYGRMAYPLSIVGVVLIGFAIASVRRRGGKGVYIAAGLTISFLYLAFMKLIEPFGSEGAIHPLLAALLPHITFFLVGVILLLSARK